MKNVFLSFILTIIITFVMFASLSEGEDIVQEFISMITFIPLIFIGSIILLKSFNSCDIKKD